MNIAFTSDLVYWCLNSMGAWKKLHSVGSSYTSVRGYSSYRVAVCVGRAGRWPEFLIVCQVYTTFLCRMYSTSGCLIRFTFS